MNTKMTFADAFWGIIGILFIVVLIIGIAKGIPSTPTTTDDKDQNDKINAYVRECNDKGGTVLEIAKGIFTSKLICNLPKK